MKTLRADQEIIYLWVNKTEFIPNKKDFPFLQNIISHAIPSRNLHIILFQGLNLDKLDKNIEELNSKLWALGIKNIHFYKLTELFSDRPECLERVSNLLSHCRSLANAIDFVKVMIGANLKKLKLAQGLLADMDCIIPENLMLTANTLTVFPLIDNNTPFKKDYRGCLDCYVENGFSFVLHGKNSVFSEILNKISAKNEDYFCKKPNDGVYSIYVETLMQYFTKCLTQNNEQLMKKYKRFSDLPDSIKSELNQLQAITYDRGNSWYESRKTSPEENLPLVFIAGYQPVFPQEIKQLKRYIFYNQLDEALDLVKKLTRKGWNPNEKIEWINELQKKENILYYLLERNSTINKESLKAASRLIVFLMENGLTRNDKALSFFMQMYQEKSVREAFEEYAKVFADQYGLDYDRMLKDIDTIKIPCRILNGNTEWVYSQTVLTTRETLDSLKKTSRNQTQKTLLFKLVNEETHSLREKTTRLSKM